MSNEKCRYCRKVIATEPPLNPSDPRHDFCFCLGQVSYEKYKEFADATSTGCFSRGAVVEAHEQTGEE